MYPIDLRSDTVTRPCPEMRAAMANAEVGDDVLERDPTMDRLERRVAEMTGMEAGLWVPSGCMGNVIALMLHLERGDRFLASAQSHVLGSELGTAAWLALGMPEALPWEGGPGKLTPLQISRNAQGAGPYYTLRTTLLCLENTHNFAGGTCMKAAEHKSLTDTARECHLKIHLDGARLWHAHVATGDSLADLAKGVDTVNLCLSKGLGAPVGSVLCGSRPAMEAARRIRKMLGGGVRQGGILAAAGLQALEYLPRLHEDHAKTQKLAAGLKAMGFNVTTPETNILFVPVSNAPYSISLLENAGVRALSVGSSLRFIPHRDISELDIDETLVRIRPLVDQMLTTWEGDRPMS